MANGELYFFKTARQNLFDIMDDIEMEWNEEHGIRKYIVPIKRTHNDAEITREIIIQADDPETAMLIAMGDFQKSGWIVDTEYESYKQLR